MALLYLNTHCPPTRQTAKCSICQRRTYILSRTEVPPEVGGGDEMSLPHGVHALAQLLLSRVSVSSAGRDFPPEARLEWKPAMHG